MPDPHSRPAPRRSGTPLLYVALGLFAIGLLAIVAILLTPVLSDAEPALWLYVTAMAGTASGLLLALAFALWSGRRAR
ncbi:hypothetical protein [Nocardia aurantia]|uniref:Uncharacterized protein n=1 Tax=Nocardia aurantia TaxID=2585199 RepID=A0A7K0DFZ0_9NOCA|nr:hypothetical protein [Nocardia aurantia]MQY24730.1 hypothetical protein [Nocardia aurantia]